MTIALSRHQDIVDHLKSYSNFGAHSDMGYVMELALYVGDEAPVISFFITAMIATLARCGADPNSSTEETNNRNVEKIKTR